MSGARAAAERRGRMAELLAALWLMAKGYRLIGRRLRSTYGEIDLAMTKAGVLVVVEVKFRPTIAEGLGSLSEHQRDRLARAALDLARRRRLGGAAIRFDLVAMAPRAWPRHVRGAWEPRRQS